MLGVFVYIHRRSNGEKTMIVLHATLTVELLPQHIKNLLLLGLDSPNL